MIQIQRSTSNTWAYLFLLMVVIGASSCSASKKIRRSNIQQIVDTAKSYRGTPYRYGGTTRSGIDCSALVAHSFSSIGFTLPRTSADQSKTGKKISKRNLQKGDVVFFATGKKRRRATHSGIVTETRRGTVYFIHASTSLGVTEDQLDHNYWKSKFLHGRRMF